MLTDKLDYDTKLKDGCFMYMLHLPTAEDVIFYLLIFFPSSDWTETLNCGTFPPSLAVLGVGGRHLLRWFQWWQPRNLNKIRLFCLCCENIERFND